MRKIAELHHCNGAIINEANQELNGKFRDQSFFSCFWLVVFAPVFTTIQQIQAKEQNDKNKIKTSEQIASIKRALNRV